jgi:hypothetical protein
MNNGINVRLQTKSDTPKFLVPLMSGKRCKNQMAAQLANHRIAPKTAILHLFAVSNRAPNPSQGESAGTAAIAMTVGGSLRVGTIRFYTRGRPRSPI